MIHTNLNKMLLICEAVSQNENLENVDLNIHNIKDENDTILNHDNNDKNSLNNIQKRDKDNLKNIQLTDKIIKNNVKKDIDNTPNNKKKILIVSGILGLFCIIGIVVYFVFSNKKSNSLPSVSLPPAQPSSKTPVSPPISPMPESPISPLVSTLERPMPSESVKEFTSPISPPAPPASKTSPMPESPVSTTPSTLERPMPSESVKEFTSPISPQKLNIEKSDNKREQSFVKKADEAQSETQPRPKELDYKEEQLSHLAEVKQPDNSIAGEAEEHDDGEKEKYEEEESGEEDEGEEEYEEGQEESEDEEEQPDNTEQHNPPESLHHDSEREHNDKPDKEDIHIIKPENQIEKDGNSYNARVHNLPNEIEKTLTTVGINNLSKEVELASQQTPLLSLSTNSISSQQFKTSNDTSKQQKQNSEKMQIKAKLIKPKTATLLSKPLANLDNNKVTDDQKAKRVNERRRQQEEKQHTAKIAKIEAKEKKIKELPPQKEQKTTLKQIDNTKKPKITSSSRVYMIYEEYKEDGPKQVNIINILSRTSTDHSKQLKKIITEKQDRIKRIKYGNSYSEEVKNTLIEDAEEDIATIRKFMLYHNISNN